MSSNPGTAAGHSTTHRFVITGTGALLDSLMASFLHDEFPGSSLTTQVDPEGTPGAVRISVMPSGRWLLVSCAGKPERHLAEALSQGAAAVVNLSATLDEMRHALAAAIDGKATFAPPDLVRWLAASSLRWPTEEQASVHLTSREAEVLRLVAEGQSNPEIARRLSISANTVRTHVHAISVKLEAHSRARLIARGRELVAEGNAESLQNRFSELSA